MVVLCYVVFGLVCVAGVGVCLFCVLVLCVRVVFQYDACVLFGFVVCCCVVIWCALLCCGGVLWLLCLVLLSSEVVVCCCLVVLVCNVLVLFCFVGVDVVLLVMFVACLSFCCLSLFCVG